VFDRIKANPEQMGPLEFVDWLYISVELLYEQHDLQNEECNQEANVKELVSLITHHITNVYEIVFVTIKHGL
jgi:hypothetical protein